MKHTTKVNNLRAFVTLRAPAALRALVALRKAKQSEQAARDALAALARDRYPDPDKAHAAALALRKSSRTTDDARAAFMKRPPVRRDLAASTIDTAEEHARRALHMAGEYSGDTTRRITWGDTPDATTTTSDGEQYSRSCTYHRTDAVHTVTLDPAGCPLLHDLDDLAAASSRDGLPLIALYPLPAKETRACADTYRAAWVAAKGKRIERVEGWLAGSASVCYHSTLSAKHAREGYERKRKAHLAELAERRRTRKGERRAALVARLCHGVTATLADARALGYCEPGIRAFQNRYGVGDEATLPELVRTGDPSAARLALSIARRVRRDTRDGAAA